MRPPYRDFSFGKNFDESNSLGEATGPPRDLHGVSGTNNGRELSAKLYPRTIARDVVDDEPPLSTHRRREKSFIIELNIGDLSNTDTCGSSNTVKFIVINFYFNRLVNK